MFGDKPRCLAALCFLWHWHGNRPGGVPSYLAHSSDGDTDSVSTMVVHDVEEIAGTQPPYGGGTMVVQRVSGPPTPSMPTHTPRWAIANLPPCPTDP